MPNSPTGHDIFARPYRHLQGSVRKEERAHLIEERDRIEEGLVCVFSAVEACQSFRIVGGEGRPKIETAQRKCLCLYFYIKDRKLGFLSVRIQTWFPFTAQICINGHEWLERQLTKSGIKFSKADNAFHWIENPRRAQRIANRFTRLPWPRLLTNLARKANPLLTDLLRDMRYYWLTDQAEYSTDILFRDRPSLRSLYEELLKYATQNFGAEDVMTFLGRKLDGRFKGEIVTDYKKRWPGARIKHRVKNNWIKMYDKHSLVLRVETVINRPYEFKILRYGKREGRTLLGWYPMAKGVANLYRYAEVSLAANERYLEALAPVEDTRRARESIAKISTSVRKNGRPYRGFNPASVADVMLFAAVLRGENAILGFRNIEIRLRLFQAQDDPVVRRRNSAAVSRLLKRLHMHGLIAKIPRSRRWRATVRGSQIMGTILTFHYDQYPKCLTEEAA